MGLHKGCEKNKKVLSCRIYYAKEEIMVGKTPQKYIQTITEYQKRHTTQINIRLNKVYDADIIEQLSKKPAKATYIKALIRKDMCYDKGEQ